MPPFCSLFVFAEAKKGIEEQSLFKQKTNNFHKYNIVVVLIFNFLHLRLFWKWCFSFLQKNKRLDRITSWWLNQPIWGSFPQGSGWKIQKICWNHHLDESCFYLLLFDFLDSDRLPFLFVQLSNPKRLQRSKSVKSPRLKSFRCALSVMTKRCCRMEKWRGGCYCWWLKSQTTTWDGAETL